MQGGLGTDSWPDILHYAGATILPAISECLRGLPNYRGLQSSSTVRSAMTNLPYTPGRLDDRFGRGAVVHKTRRATAQLSFLPLVFSTLDG